MKRIYSKVKRQDSAIALRKGRGRKKKNKVSDAMQSEGKSGGGRMMCTA